MVTTTSVPSNPFYTAEIERRKHALDTREGFPSLDLPVRTILDEVATRVANEFVLDVNNKRGLFVEEVIVPLAERLSHYDGDARALVSGSIAKSEGVIRPGSDIDCIFLSSRLDPQNYLNFLKALRAQSRLFIQETGLIPFWFTQIAREEGMRYICANHFQPYVDRKEIKDPDDVLVPIHFLFYPDVMQMFLREPKQLALRLLKNSKSIKGNTEGLRVFPSEFPSADSFSLGKDAARWTIERALAELVLNYDLLPYDYLVSEYASLIYDALRIYFFNFLFTGESEMSMPKILKKLGGEELYTTFEPLMDIRLHGRKVGKQYSLAVLEDSAVKLLKALDKLSLKSVEAA